MNGPVQFLKVTLDTGANSGNYVGKDFLRGLTGIQPTKCKHRVRLGDGQSMLEIKQSVSFPIQLLRDNTYYTDPVHLHFYIVESLGDEAIIGAPSLLTDCFSYFLEVLDAESQLDGERAHKLVVDLQRLFLDLDLELARKQPRRVQLEKLVRESKRIGKAYRNDRAEKVSALSQLVDSADDQPNIGDVLDPWAMPAVFCPEEVLTPDPVSFIGEMLHFMETSVEESRRDYLAMLDDHVSEGMRASVPAVMDLLQSELAQEVFAPSEWKGMKVLPVTMQINGELPSRMFTRARPLRSELFDSAKQEFERLKKYFYEESDSPIASPLVIAPKATYPYIRFCGDYRKVNMFISIPQQPIPIVQHELVKASKFKYFVDLDMANSFHQIPLAKEFSDLLSVQTPWGLYRPKFLPEGVGPASGLLQHIVRDVFVDFEAWTIVIFDNFLVLADSYDDALEKLGKVLRKCRDTGIVLKMKKSWIGVEKVTFFGYELTHGQWQLSQTRKLAIESLPFPKSKKEMQSFLGAALFFHNHVPNYSECLLNSTRWCIKTSTGTLSHGPTITRHISVSSRSHS